MENTYSKYKFWGGFGLLVGANGLILCKLIHEIYLLINRAGLEGFGIWKPVVSFTGLAIVFLILFVRQCQYLILNYDGITFYNPILPFIQSKKSWEDFDFFILVDETSRHNTHEAIWLIKNEKVSKRISSFYYSNYEDIKKDIGVLDGGKRTFGSINQFLCMIHINKIPH